MHRLAWITSSRRSGSGSALGLVAGYMLDAPPAECTREDLLEVAPDIIGLFRRGRMVPIGGPRPHLVKTHFLPDAEALNPYREATGKVVYVVRDPRALISSIATGKGKPEDHQRMALKLISDLNAPHRQGKGHGTWPQHVREWTDPERNRLHFPNLQDVCVVRFEELKSDPASILYKIIDFLAVPGGVDEARVQRAVQEWTPERVQDSPIVEEPPGIMAFREPVRPPTEGNMPEPSLAELGEAVEAAYVQRLEGDPELAALIKQFGYAH